MASAEKIRNLAIIAHIDHGKTTLIDSIFRAAQVFRDNQVTPERFMDSNELERERGITIRSKHCTVYWNDYQINIIDTPGHADFSGEVERVLSMVDSVLLLVDANEGPMPQTRYVLMQALKFGFRPIVIVNKVERPNANPALALDKTFDLFLELGATDAQADFPVLYGSGLAGWLTRDLDTDQTDDMTALFETIVEHVPAPTIDPDAPFRMQISTLVWNEFIGRIGCGRVLSGSMKAGQPFQRCASEWLDLHNPAVGWKTVSTTTEKAARLWETRGLDRIEVEEISAGDIVWIAGPETINIGDTFADLEWEDAALPPLEIEEPTVSMNFLINSSPFAGSEGKAITLRQIKDRLARELHTNVAMRVEDIGRSDGVKVSGRGELHLAILIEEMRREGLEFCVSRPEVITRLDKQGQICEPLEHLIIDVPDHLQGVVIENISARKGQLKNLENTTGSIVRIEFEIPTRGLIGYRSEFLTQTRGLGIMASRLIGYTPWRGEIRSRVRGSLVSMENGAVTAYQIENLQERAVLFVEPTDKVYLGQVVGENSRSEDMPCNPTKRKATTNHRAAGKDHYVGLNPARKMTLDQAIEWIGNDELVELTPQSIRIRKTILDAEERKKAQRRQEAMAG